MANREGTAYEKWAQGERIPIIRGYSVADMYRILLEPWERKGGSGAFIILEGGEGRTSAYLCEIPPGGSLKPQKHLFEEMIYILQGQGETKVWNEGGPEQTFAWHEYSLFAIPLNAWHQHRNTGDQPAKYVAVTDAPLMLNLLRNPKFIFDNNFTFRDRYNGEKDYFDGVGKIVEKRLWSGGLIPDVRETKLGKSFYGPGSRSLSLKLSNNSWGAHIARIEVGAYKMAHRHAGGAHLIIVEGTGYANMWKDGGKRIRADFQKGSLYSPPEGWFHQHFNTGAEVVRQVAFRELPGIGKIYQMRLGIKQGGDKIEWEDEDPEVRKTFEEELGKKGLKSRLPPLR